MVNLKILPLSPDIGEMYKSHDHHHPGDSGLDLYVVEDQIINARDSCIVKLGIKTAAFNEKGQNISWLLMPRSSISKTPLRLSNSIGLIDAGYRGEVMVALDNIRDKDYKLTKGDRIVQAVAFSGDSINFELVDSLDTTLRGDGGFGSTTRCNGDKMEPEIKRVKASEENNGYQSKISIE